MKDTNEFLSYQQFQDPWNFVGLHSNPDVERGRKTRQNQFKTHFNQCNSGKYIKESLVDSESSNQSCNSGLRI